MFENVRACLFDLDGTLIRPSIDFDWMRQVVLEIVDRYGVSTQSLTAMPVLEIIDHVTAELSARGSTSVQAFRQEAHQATVDIELEAADHARAYPGVPEALAQLRTWGYGVAIVTRNCREAVERILAHNTLHYDVILTRDDVNQVKPDPRHLLAALQVMGVPGTEAIMCGDHPMDIIVGQRINARTVAVLAPGYPLDRFDGLEPDLVVSSVTELLDYLCPLR